MSVLLFLNHSMTIKFDVVWESAETGSGIENTTYGISGMVLKDIDKDGKIELIGPIDNFSPFCDPSPNGE